MTINYKITIYDVEGNIRVIDNLNDEFDSNGMFPDVIEFIVDKNNIDHFQIYVEDLKTNTWDKVLPDDLSSQLQYDDYHYKWLNYTLKDVQDAFHLFDNVINIVIDGPGIGRYLGKMQGIKFYINNNEKDRHQFEPHVHCEYAGEEMRIRIDVLTIMKKDKPFKNTKKVKVALKWVKEHQRSLLKFYNDFAINNSNNIKFEVNI